MNDKKLEFSDQEVWLDIYCAAIQSGRSVYEAREVAMAGLKNFKKLFDEKN